MYSDPGANFKGTDNALKNLDWNKIQHACASDNIEWIVNLPKSPWWGGWWERLIGLVKDLLRKILGKSCIDYEEMVTVLCDCESIINTRPLTYVTDDPNDLATLTPDMFLKEVVKSEVVVLDHIDAKFLNERRNDGQLIMNELRQRFRVEYLAQLPFRKGDKEIRLIEIGEIVLMADENKKKLNWPLARVIDIYPGKGNKVRVAKVKTAKSILVRPVKKLIPLEIRPEEIITTGIEYKKKSKGKLIAKPSQDKEIEIETKTSDNQVQAEPKVEIETKPSATFARSGRLVRKVDRLIQI